MCTIAVTPDKSARELINQDAITDGHFVMTTFAVIVPNLNSSIVDQTMAALAQQTFPANNYTVIVVGIDAPNRVRASARVWFDHTPYPMPPAQARNRGAAQSVADVLVFTDADGIPHPDWLAVLAERFVDPKVMVVGGGIAFASHPYWTLADNLSMFYDYMADLPLGERQILPSLNLAVRRAAFVEVNGFDERYPRPSGEDADLCLRLARRGYTLYFEPRAVVRHQPSRSRVVDLLQHGFYQGMYSTKVDSRYASGILSHRMMALLLAPILATAATMRVFGRHVIWVHWHTAPAVWLAKLAWCVGAASRPKWTTD